VKRNKKVLASTSGEAGLLFEDNAGFAAAEACRLLRTNILFSFSSEEKGRVIGVTSSVRGEGKSSTACNLAYVLTQDGRKTLLIDGDLRLPSVSAKLNLTQSPGLSNLLVSKMPLESALKHCDAAPSLSVITAGDCPPNPSELLGSQRMKELIESPSKEYEYIIFDLPPVAEVSDALIVSKYLDGIIMVVRNGAADKRVLADAIRQLRLVNARILGFAFIDASESKSSYRKKYGGEK